MVQKITLMAIITAGLSICLTGTSFGSTDCALIQTTLHKKSQTSTNEAEPNNKKTVSDMNPEEFMNLINQFGSEQIKSCYSKEYFQMIESQYFIEVLVDPNRKPNIQLVKDVLNHHNSYPKAESDDVLGAIYLGILFNSDKTYVQSIFDSKLLSPNHLIRGFPLICHGIHIVSAEGYEESALEYIEQALSYGVNPEIKCKNVSIKQIASDLKKIVAYEEALDNRANQKTTINYNNLANKLSQQNQQEIILFDSKYSLTLFGNNKCEVSVIEKFISFVLSKIQKPSESYFATDINANECALSVEIKKIQ